MNHSIQPRNYTIMPRTGVGMLLRGLGMNVNQLGPSAPPNPTNYVYGLRRFGPPAYRAPAAAAPIASCPAWGCRTAPVMTVDTSKTNAPAAASTLPATVTPPAGGSTAQQTAGTPVPAGYDLHSVFIASNGAQWEFSASQGKWINVGTPYNLNAVSAPAAAAVQQTALPGDGSAAAPTVNVTVPTPTAGGSTYQSILDWLSQSTLLSPVPNWILAAGLGLVALKFMQPATGKR